MSKVCFSTYITNFFTQAHGAAVSRFRAMFGQGNGMEIGITNCGWKIYPLRPTEEDDVAAEQFMETTWGWFFDPVIFGDYPSSMRERAGDDLPKFSADESKMLRENGLDFLGVNYYTSMYVAASDAAHKASGTDTGVPALHGKFTLTPATDGGQLIGAPAGTSWLFVVPQGLRDLLNWLDTRYPNHAIRITENGCAQPTYLNPINDTFRVDYYRSHIQAMTEAIVYDQINVVGYYAWSLFDNYEWADGYRTRFGIIYVDYTTQVRTPKLSALWYSDLIRSQKGQDAQLPSINHHHSPSTSTRQSSIFDSTSSLPSILFLAILASVLILGTLLRRVTSSSSIHSNNQSPRVELPSILATPRLGATPRHTITSSSASRYQYQPID
uniref:Beta-glucosidase n=1 Tax=Aureoumbra lagunensis TaxID=44058 RepID=A0A7S3JVG5_9STRA|mmetsp:Transcript_16886/g.21893  ORF Transcript_16886/g.21893 Transcript_16886/m.21893 type:complete len:383 (+) Transcript_16886:861-2009(+)